MLICKGLLALQSLSFARAASVMRACAFKIQPGTNPAGLHLPFVGRARAQQICDLATTGTTPELEEHRSGIANPLRAHIAAPLVRPGAARSQVQRSQTGFPATQVEERNSEPAAVYLRVMGSL